MLALAVPAGGEECVPTTSEPDIEAFGFYLDNDLCQVPPGDPTGWPAPEVGLWHYLPQVEWDYDGDGDADGCLFSIWTYEGSNGIPGLQRGDEVVDDTCGGQIESDTLAFY